jgi:hypothetical protein
MRAIESILVNDLAKLADAPAWQAADRKVVPVRVR